MSRLQRILVFCGLLLVLILTFSLFGHHSSSSRRLQAYRAELVRQGEKLNYAALKAAVPANTNGSFALFTNAAASLRKARMNAAWLDMRKYTAPGSARALCLVSAPHPSWDELRDEIAKIEAPLNEIREAMKDPQPDWNVGTNVVNGLPNFIAIRSAAQWLALAGLADLHSGRLEDALQNIEALAGVAQMNREEYTLVAQMIRIAVAGLGLGETWEALQVPGWTAPQLERMQAAWQPVNLTEALEKGLLGERAMGEDLWGKLRQTNGLKTTSAVLARPVLGPASWTNSLQTFASEHLLFPLYKMTSIDDDELFYLEMMQQSLVALRSMTTGASWANAREKLDTTFSRLNQMTASQRFRYAFSSIAIPNFIKALENGARAEEERQLTIAAIALRRFHVAHGTFPTNLEQLVGVYLPAKPFDLMSGQPLRYHLEPNGTFKLYSVGLDGKDHGGDATPGQGGRLGLWEGRDAVWPSLTAP